MGEEAELVASGALLAADSASAAAAAAAEALDTAKAELGRAPDSGVRERPRDHLRPGWDTGDADRAAVDVSGASPTAVASTAPAEVVSEGAAAAPVSTSTAVDSAMARECENISEVLGGEPGAERHSRMPAPRSSPVAMGTGAEDAG